MDACIDAGEEPVDISTFSFIFDYQPDELLQCVTPYVHRTWITGVQNQ